MTAINYKKSLALILLLGLTNTAFAGGVGYIDYAKVAENYQFAKSTIREIEAKSKEIQSYLEQKEAEFDKIETPLQKKKFEKTVQAELKVKEDAFNNFREKREEAVYARIHAVSEKIRLEKGLDTILDNRSVFSGGIDITDDMIKTLNADSNKK